MNNIHDNIFICCFKEKKFVLYDMKKKTEYLSVECGGFRRPLSVFMKSLSNSSLSFSLCFCKEKNIYFSFKNINNKTNNIIPYEQIYYNSDFHAKNVSFLLWFDENYFCTCSEDGTIKLMYINKKKNIRNREHIQKTKQNKNVKVNNMKDIKNDIFNNNNYNIYDKKKKINYLKYELRIIQNIYNHTEPIFYMSFLKSPFYFSRKFKLFISVGAKNSANIFYAFVHNENSNGSGTYKEYTNNCPNNNNKNNNNKNNKNNILGNTIMLNNIDNSKKNAPIIYHLEKLRTHQFSSDLRYLCVHGFFNIISKVEYTYVIQTNIFIGTSIGYIFHYTGLYEFTIYNKIIFSKIIKRATIISTYNLNSTILSLSWKQICINRNYDNIDGKNIYDINNTNDNNIYDNIICSFYFTLFYFSLYSIILPFFVIKILFIPSLIHQIIYTIINTFFFFFFFNFYLTCS
ncbi:hypothetical protein PFAG_01124 [Plasmodium falciparum Santa Lucia]|uniref:WD repeat-containing protein n=1 Tax=Plasmodium falciparum Santa Lucia TaxID=478859 RepID=W7FUP8_PLAFA|nr:hypothetical protein PFAG_01124 [Plasmodium falciparum Santa Lucia]